MTPDRSTIVDFIADIIERRGSETYLGEAVSMRAHFLQCAHLAENDDAPDTLVAAALMHDIGHYLGEFDDDALNNGINNWHDEAGAAVLRNFFSAAVVEPVRMHVNAKRYLCAVEPTYFAKLSPASVQSLEVQGGPFSAQEVAEFERSPWLDDAIRLRRYDEGAKDIDAVTPDFNHYRPLLASLVLTD